MNPAGADSSPRLPPTLAEARAEARLCTRCDLWRNATQTVFGEGPEGARLLMVGEQPGDREDVSGRPFVGPAGRVLDAALAAADIDRSTVYVTNAVKHFKNEPRGRKRLHRRPDAREIESCRWWLGLELRFVRPTVVVALGATALRGVLGRPATVESLRGRVAALPDGRRLVTTVHPSLLLRLRAAGGYEAGFAALVADFRLAKEAAGLPAEP